MPERSSVKRKDDLHLYEDTSFIGSVLEGVGNTVQPTLNLPTESQRDFYQQYKMVLGISFQIRKQLHNTYYLKEQILQKIEQLQQKMENNSSIQTSQQARRKESMKKRSRRMADEIQRRHKCSVEFCEKQYGSEGSLIQHIKLKHPELYYSLL